MPAKVLPPRSVEGLGHDFVDHDVVALRGFSLFGPETLCGRTSVCRQPAEPLGELGANGLVVRAGKGVAIVVVEREEELDEVDMASGIRDSGRDAGTHANMITCLTRPQLTAGS